jgi:hypothetical protein
MLKENIEQNYERLTYVNFSPIYIFNSLFFVMYLDDFSHIVLYIYRRMRKFAHEINKNK